MTGKRFVGTRLPVFVALLACGPARCGGDATGPCPPEQGVYSVQLTSAPVDLNALLLSIEGGGTKVVTLKSGGPTSQLAQTQGANDFRALVHGGIRLGEIASVTISNDLLGPPRVTVIDAAAGASGGYRQYSSSAVTFVVKKVGGQ